ncbi:cbb3-type cytochrome c oxidase subunit III [Pseudoduganella lurida]|uniref:Cbb3-type cytochrome c oxidase subunit III n=1 Tax=Pseudoduganella lurida TaxID=1036180 RepID=A0A562RJP1_9BURK|nr:c-type cytochrome [Pseudoduganella lurida]TWI69143.1 cbb3-type cytochrome c oxidase subunit III [Pseudoduganella lurida]
MKRSLALFLLAVCQAVPGFADPVQAAPAVPEPNATGGKTPYQVVGGDHVDARTLNGWRTWRALSCERCHGAQQEGAVGPALVNSLKVLTPDEFRKTVLQGRIDKGMPNFDGSKQVVDNIDNLYAYLKGRSDGAIKPGRLQAIDKESGKESGK